MNSSLGYYLIWGRGLTTSNCIKITKNIVISVLTDIVNVLPDIFFSSFYAVTVVKWHHLKWLCFREYIVEK